MWGEGRSLQIKQSPVTEFVGGIQVNIAVTAPVVTMQPTAVAPIAGRRRMECQRATGADVPFGRIDGTCPELRIAGMVH